MQLANLGSNIWGGLGRGVIGVGWLTGYCKVRTSPSLVLWMLTGDNPTYHSASSTHDPESSNKRSFGIIWTKTINSAPSNISNLHVIESRSIVG